VARLSKQEQAALEKLQAKAEAPDDGPLSRNVSFSLDINDDKQIKRAQALGLITDLPDGFFGEVVEEGEEDEEADDTPKRDGYFGGKRKR